MPFYNTLLAALKDNAIPFTEQQHAPMQSVEDAVRILGITHGQGTKTLILKTKDGALLAVSVRDDARLDLKVFAAQMGLKRLSFASAEELQQKLQIDMGAAAPLGYPSQMPTYIASDVFDLPTVYFNPGRNDITLGVSGADLQRLATLQGVQVFDLPR